MREGVWTYLGRANYDAGKLPQARQALERALARNEPDYFANLYLGLVLAKGEERGQSVRELRNGLEGFDEWFNYTTRNAFYGQFWDPSGAIRSEIDGDLAMISGSNIDWPKLVASVEWVGKKTEEEIDLARRDERRQYETINVENNFWRSVEIGAARLDLESINSENFERYERLKIDLDHLIETVLAQRLSRRANSLLGISVATSRAG